MTTRDDLFRCGEPVSAHAEREDGTIGGIPPDYCPGYTPDRALTVREAARRRQPLDGTDAQALEGALRITERERDDALAREAIATQERDGLVAQLVALFDWSDTGYLHAAMHIDNAVKNLRADLSVARRERDEARALHKRAKESVERKRALIDATSKALVDEVRAAVEAEKERCAKIADATAKMYRGEARLADDSRIAMWAEDQAEGAETIAAAIRSRSHDAPAEAADRRVILDRLTAESQRLGLYDDGGSDG